MKPTKSTQIFLTILAFIGTIVFTSCSSNNNDIEEQELSEIVMKNFVEDIKNMAVPSNLSNSQNQYAQQANAQFEFLKTIGSSYATLFTVPTNAVAAKLSRKFAGKSNSFTSKTYTWSANGTSITYTITENSDRYSFTYNIVSSDFTGKFMDGYQLKDGSYAEVSLYANNQTVSTIKWWVTNEITKIQFEADNNKLVLELNTSDNSGSIKVYESSFLSALFKWNANGTGSYTDYNTNETYTW
ncbi:hypothetical protein [Polaribacter cellanae]|uniref:Lipoprotein n=1 Tax=Polaribacter cellanae TaxID=2818493 RepID=A0A975H8H8_9FLAO|nr:hypothetical protein [Polaribacter cellanae]QTE21615.1 hypothetical protein J3359_12385 [Polaribacter cellanae]